MRKVIVFIIWLIVLSGLIGYLLSHSHDLRAILRFSFFNIAALALLFALTQFLNSLKTLIIVKKDGVALSGWESFCLTNVNTMANYLPFKGGLFATAIYLKKRHNLSYANFTKLAIASQLIQIFTTTLAAVAFVIIHYFITGAFLGRLFLIFCLLLISILAGLFLLRQVLKNTKSIIPEWENIREAIGGLGMIMSDRKLLLGLSIVNLMAVLAMGFRFVVAFKMLSFNAPFILPFIAGQVKMIAILLSITPSGLGVAELAAGGISELIGSNVSIGVYAASLDRVVSVLILICMSIFSFGYLYRYKKPKYQD